jgi:glycosyltransferase involved in cell wall biosynthesis
MLILYIHHNATPPSPDPCKNRFLLTALEGDVLQPIWLRSAEEIERMYGPGSYPVYTAGQFRFHWFLVFRPDGSRRKLAAFWFYLSRGFRIYRERRFDCVVTYAHMMTGICGAILKLLTGARLIVEIVSVPENCHLVQRPRATWRDRFMQFCSELCLHISLWSCDLAHLLGPRLIASYPWLRKVRTTVFASFVPVSFVSRRDNPDEQYVLTVGAPWYLKGADLLMAAFRRLAADFPHVKLKVVGYFPNREALEPLTGGLPQIEILKHRPNSEVLQLMGEATIFALPSRSEGMGCVILEAMAAGLPIVASDVGGIPTLVRDGDNGFLVPSEDVPALELRLRQLLSDRALRERMGARSLERARTEFNEKAYGERFTRMVEEVVRG